MSSSPPPAPSKLPVWLLPCIVVTALISSYAIRKRIQVESLNKATSLSVEMETVESLAAAEGKPVDEALKALKAQGVNAVVLSEENITDLVLQGQATFTPSGLTVGSPLVNGVASLNNDMTTRVTRGLSLRFANKPFTYDAVTHVFTFKPGTPFSMVRQCPIGLNPDQALEAQKAGMIIIGRANNPAGVSEDYVRGTLAWMNDLGATIFLPMGDQVLGRRDALGITEETLAGRHMLYASPEFTKIGGDSNIVDKMPESVVRLHSAQAAELDKLPYEDAVDRYSKAARERNMRILLLRPVSFAADHPLTAFTQFARDVNAKIHKDGGAVGKPKPFTDSNIPWPIKLLLALSVVPTAFWVGTVFIRNRQIQIAGGALLVLLAFATKVHIGLQVFALLSAITFPTAAFLILDRRSNLESPKTGVIPTLIHFLLTTGISLVGGLAVAGLLNSLAYFVKASEFQGIKIAVFLPIILVGTYFLYRFQDMTTALKSPVTWIAALAALGLLIALAFMNSRTGNDNPAGVSDLELKIRNVLDTLLLVRPRTKSFMIGHPMLYVGIALMLWRAKTGSTKYGVLAAILLTVGAIGQTDVVNTFCHLHTPFMLSLLRTGVAIVPGVILGMVFWFLLKRGLRLDGVK